MDLVQLSVEHTTHVSGEVSRSAPAQAQTNVEEGTTMDVAEIIQNLKDRYWGLPEHDVDWLVRADLPKRCRRTGFATPTPRTVWIGARRCPW